MEKLTAFLEEERCIECDECYCGIPVKEHNSRIVNFVLDIVGEEMEKKSAVITKGHETVWLYDIKQILTNLKK